MTRGKQTKKKSDKPKKMHIHERQRLAKQARKAAKKAKQAAKKKAAKEEAEAAKQAKQGEDAAAAAANASIDAGPRMPADVMGPPVHETRQGTKRKAAAKGDAAVPAEEEAAPSKRQREDLPPLSCLSKHKLLEIGKSAGCLTFVGLEQLGRWRQAAEQHAQRELRQCVERISTVSTQGKRATVRKDDVWVALGRAGTGALTQELPRPHGDDAPEAGEVPNIVRKKFTQDIRNYLELFAVRYKGKNPRIDDKAIKLVKTAIAGSVYQWYHAKCEGYGLEEQQQQPADQPNEAEQGASGSCSSDSKQDAVEGQGDEEVADVAAQGDGIEAGAVQTMC